MTRKIGIYITALVWLINGLYCKILNGVPRHQAIVERILGEDYARELTFLIGTSEVLMCIWILLGWYRTWNVWSQIGIVLSMNVLEFFLADDLLLWGKWNAGFALLFAGFVYWINRQKKSS